VKQKIFISQFIGSLPASSTAILFSCFKPFLNHQNPTFLTVSISQKHNPQGWFLLLIASIL